MNKNVLIEQFMNKNGEYRILNRKDVEIQSTSSRGHKSSSYADGLPDHLRL